jgi:hypothetical protein
MVATTVRRAVLRCAGGLLLCLSACTDDFRLAATNFQIVPNPAHPGDSVIFAFSLIVVPAQQFTVTALIDGSPHTSQVRTEAVAGPFVISVGAAADLMLQYGAGVHEGAIEVRLRDGGRTATTTHTFLLEEPPPLGTGP